MMTDQERAALKAEIIQEVEERLTGIAIREDTQGILADVRRKWIQGPTRTWAQKGSTEPSPFYKAFGPIIFWRMWENIRRLVCLAMGVGYVRQIKDPEAASELADRICKILYDFRMELNEKEEKQIETEGE